MPATPFPLGDISVVRAYFGLLTPTSSEDLGLNMSCNITKTEESAEVKNAEGGSVSVDDITTGLLVTVTLEATQSSLAALALMSPSVAAGGESTQLTLTSSVGESLRYDNSGALPLVLKRVTNKTVSADTSEWITFFEAAPKLDSEWVFDGNTQIVTKAVFRCYAVEEVASGETYAIGQVGELGYVAT